MIKKGRRKECITNRKNAKVLEMVTCDNKESSKGIKIYEEYGRQNNDPLEDVHVVIPEPVTTLSFTFVQM